MRKVAFVIVPGAAHLCVGMSHRSAPVSWCAVNLSGRKTTNRTSLISPGWFVDDGPTGWIP
jgi:hypothetical protein